MKKEDKYTATLILVLLIAFVARIAYVDTLPAALFGDIIEHLRMAKTAQIVRWGGDGALFPLITTITTRIGGLSFLTLKITSALISLLGVLATMLYAKTLTKSRAISIYSGLCMALSFWDISMSHSGKPYSLIPFFAAIIPLLLLEKRRVAAGIAIGMSLYSQAAAWGLFALSLFNPITFVSAIIAGVFFFKEMFTSPENFFSSGSHIGEKLAIGQMQQMGPLDIILQILKNYYLQLQALFIHGDTGFRGSTPNQAHLDEITAVFLIGGMVYLFRHIRKENIKKFLLFLAVPFLLVQLPAALDIHNPASVPSFGRTVGMVPYISIVAAYGIFGFTSVLSKFKKPLLFIIFALIGGINLYRFWYVFPRTLPDHNVPFAEIIAQDATSVSSMIPTYTYEPGWGQWGQPEPASFAFLARKETMYPPLSHADICMRLNGTSTKAVIYASPRDYILPELIVQCGWKIEKVALISVKGESVGRRFDVSLAK